MSRPASMRLLTWDECLAVARTALEQVEPTAACEGCGDDLEFAFIWRGIPQFNGCAGCEWVNS